MAINSLNVLPVTVSLKLGTVFIQSFQQNFQACNMKKLQLLSLAIMEDFLLCHLWALNWNSIISGKIHFAIIYLQNQWVYKVKKVYRYAWILQHSLWKS